MAREGVTSEEPRPRLVDKLAREKVFLAEQSSEGGIKVLPGKNWAFHYKNGVEARDAAVSGLLSGTAKAGEVVDSLRPDVLIYNAADLEQGLPAVSGRVRDISAYVAHYDYPRFANFLAEMHGTGVTASEAQALYDGIAQSRIRKKMMDAYGYTGRKQMEAVLTSEAERNVQQIGTLHGVNKVLATLKLNWLAEDLQLVRTEQRNLVVGQLSGEERALYDRMRDPFDKYVRRGEQAAYEELVKEVKDGVPTVSDEKEQSVVDDSQERLEKALEEYKDEAVPPVTEGDSAIPPDDADEYHTPINPGETKEQAMSRPFFEIEPTGESTEPLVGYYASGRKSYYDVDTKTWSKRKQLSPYSSSIAGTQRQQISGLIDSGLKSIPLPNGYGLDAASLDFQRGQGALIFRDQNGCFYIKASGVGKFSIDFLKEDAVFVGQPIQEDTALIHRGMFLPETEALLSSLSGSALENAESIRQFLLSKHFYPGDGDLQMAQALQLKLRTESTGDDYIQNLESSVYLECYSANTLYISLLRKAGIPSRLVVGHHVESAKSGKATIDATTGHAWSEIWDGSAWRRLDATPNPKQQKKEQSNDQGSPSQEAVDEGIDRQDQGQEAQQGDAQGGQPQESGGQGQSQGAAESESTSSESQQGQSQASQERQSTSSGGSQMGTASDQDVAQAESDLSEAQQFAEQTKQEKRDLDQKVQKTESFKELEELRRQANDSELFDDMKDDLEQKLQAKEDQLKKAIKENLEEMVDDGFLEEERREELARLLEEKGLEELDRVAQEISRESTLFNEYQAIEEEVRPLVEQWFDYFTERLPRQEEVELDEDSLTRQGAFNRHSVMRPRNLLFGTVKNPRVIKPSVKPKFLASVEVDVSGSMAGEKLKMARKQLVFYNELFSRISEEFGFIRYANNIFSDNVVGIKTYDQDYQSPARYDWEDGSRSTIKARLMQTVHTQGGTNMLPAIQKAAADLNKETFDYPDYASAFYFIGDGGDTSGNSVKIKEFLKEVDQQEGFGGHMLSAIMLGDESQRQELAKIFGDDHTTVAPDFDALIEQSMYKFDEDIEAYLADKTTS